MQLYQEKAARDEIDRLSDFFDVEVETPEFETTWTIPRVQGDDYSVLKLNPVLPWGGKHESRHVVHRAVIEDVVEENPEAALDFYKEELEELNPSTSFYTAMVDAACCLTNETCADELYEEFKAGEDHAVGDLIFSKNVETDLQAEVFGHDAKYELASGFGAAGALWAANFTKNIDNFRDITRFMEQAPEVAVIAGISLPTAYLLGRDAYDIAASEDLTEKNLEEHGKNDRKRAMLYNSQLESDLDEFLEVMDGYGIE